jgi:uncharacterized protein (DUF2147 family)
MRAKFDHHRWTVFLILISMAATFVPGRGAVAASPEPAPLNSPVGNWKTVDDKTGQVKAIVNIREQNGELEGRVVKLFNPPASHPLCLKCSGTLKNQPVMDMRILWGVRKDGDEWTGGHILDPESGNIYRCTITLEDSGKVLRVRGYIGLSVFGRTERWLRVNE